MAVSNYRARCWTACGTAQAALTFMYTHWAVLTTRPGSQRASPGYGITLVAETTAGRYITAERCMSGVELLRARDTQLTPEEVGEQAGCQLLSEVRRCAAPRACRHQVMCTALTLPLSCPECYAAHSIGGVYRRSPMCVMLLVRLCWGLCRGGITDGAHQGLAVILAALGPGELNTVRLGALSMHTVKTLRHVKDLLGIEFDIRPDADSQTIVLSCVGMGLRNMGRKVY